MNEWIMMNLSSRDKISRCFSRVLYSSFIYIISIDQSSILLALHPSIYLFTHHWSCSYFVQTNSFFIFILRPDFYFITIEEINIAILSSHHKPSSYSSQIRLGRFRIFFWREVAKSSKSCVDVLKVHSNTWAGSWRPCIFDGCWNLFICIDLLESGVILCNKAIKCVFSPEIVCVDKDDILNILRIYRIHSRINMNGKSNQKWKLLKLNATY